jgi:hypothetical protein
MVGGQWLLKDRRFTTLDWPAIARHVQSESRNLADFCQKLA